VKGTIPAFLPFAAFCMKRNLLRENRGILPVDGGLLGLRAAE
jgi:hypothetical protein